MRQLKRTYVNYSPIPEMQLRVGNIRVNSGLASHTGYAAQTFVSQVEGFTRSHRLGVAAVGDYKEIGYQFAVFKDNSYLGRLTADVTDYLTLGFHYHSENDRYGLEASATVDKLTLQGELLGSNEWYAQWLYEHDTLPGIGYRYTSVEEQHAVIASYQVGDIEMAVEHNWQEDEKVTLVSALVRF